MSNNQHKIEEEMQKDFADYVDEHDKLTEEEEKVSEEVEDSSEKEAEDLVDDDYKNKLDGLRGK